MRFFIGYEGLVIIFKLKNWGVCLKFYLDNEVTFWLRLNLKDRGTESRLTWNQIGKHEYQALKIMSRKFASPRPILHFWRILIMTYEGIPLDRCQKIPNSILSNEGSRLFRALQDSKVKHNDIKTSNILFKSNRLTLIDFTFADLPSFQITSKNPNLEWGRFGKDYLLLSLDKCLPE